MPRLAWIAGPAALLAAAFVAVLVALDVGGAATPGALGGDPVVLVGLPIAKLLASGGMWGRRRVLGEEWIAASTRPALPTTPHFGLGFWLLNDDVYAIGLRRGEKLFVSVVPSYSSNVVLAVWRPATLSVSDLARQDLRVRLSNRPGRRERLAFTSPAAAWYYLQVRVTARTATPVAYRLSVVRVR